MSQSSDDVILLDVATAARRVVSFIEGMDESAFRADFKTQSAVQHQMLIMGEAVKRLSPEMRASMDAIPWSAIARMRDRLIHGYDTVDLGVVWRTASGAVPTLLDRLTPILPADDSNSNGG
jgi:uncharacterized protein with HEPN domain